MDIKEILLLCWAAFTVAMEPEVYENVKEYLEDNKEIKRNVRNSHLPLNSRAIVYEPPTFDYKKTYQQDRLKARYAEQQKVDLTRMPSLYAPVSYIPAKHRAVRESKPEGKILDDWRPFQPRLVRQNKEGKVYIERATANTKLKTSETETVVKEATDRQDNFLPSEFSQIVYVHPSLLRGEYDRNSPIGKKLSMAFGVDQPENQLNVLTDLIGKNPNVQIEGLKRLLEEPSQDNYIVPVVKNPEPFQMKDHTPIAEKEDDLPNMKTKAEEEINFEDIISGKLPNAPITQESLAKLQKQLDQASQRNIEEALAKAEEQARAHVEAQHKAIAAAQMAMMEDGQNIYQSPQALPLVQPAPVYPTPINSMNVAPKIRSQQNSVVHKYVAHEINIPEVPQRASQHNILISNEKSKYNSMSYHKPSQSVTKMPPIIVENEYPVSRTPIRITSTTPSPKMVYSSLKPTVITVTLPTVTTPPPSIPKSPLVNPLKAAIISKNVRYYAPNHIHEAVAQKQAEKTIRAQVMSNNKAILKKKNVSQRIISKEMNKKDYEFNDNIDEREEHPAATTYHQQVAFSDPEIKSVYSDQLEEEGDDLQYAAKYAFGYQIRDNDEGMDYGHQEKRNGRSAEGSYYVVLPDGRRQKVEYYADDSGYHAKVTYENFAQHK